MPDKKVDFAKAFKELENITKTLESQDTDLEKSVDLYESGVELVKKLRKQLTSLETRIQKIDVSKE